MNGQYILDGKKAVKADDLLSWAEWFEKSDRIVAKTDLPNGVKVSTVFLGLDHGFGGTPLLFETMIFGLPEGHEHADFQDRYTTWEEAEIGHKRAVDLIK
jgi:hypothetical protein